MNVLTYTVPDAPVVDAFRGFVAVAGILLVVVAPIAWWRLRHLVPARIRGLFAVLITATIYIAATEAQQIGHPFLLWRLPLGFLTIVGAITYIVRLSVAVINDGDTAR